MRTASPLTDPLKAGCDELTHRGPEWLRKVFRLHCELLTDDDLERAIRRARAKAAAYDLKHEGCVDRYVEMTFLLGSGFDCDTLLPWAREILNDVVLTPCEHTRMRGLYDKAAHYLNHIARDHRGRNPSPALSVISEIGRMCGELDVQLVAESTPLLSVVLEHHLRRAYNAKCTYVGPITLRRAVLCAMAAAHEYGITSIRATAVYSILAFELGSGFDRDPLLPWASSILLDDTLGDGNRRADALLAEALPFLRKSGDTIADIRSLS